MTGPRSVGGQPPPPPYSRIDPKTTGHDPGPSHPSVARNGISPQQRRSMEDEGRSLPDGWVRQFDAKNNHHFYVDTRANPPRSIWQHPFDDEQYLSSLTPAEREEIEGLTRHSSISDIVAEDSDDDSHRAQAPLGFSSTAGQSSAQAHQHDNIGKVHLWGRKMKDRITQTTHEQREIERRRREEEEVRAYEAHLAFRRALQRAMETGQPQFIGRDRDGKDVYIEPPRGSVSFGYGSGYGINPYAEATVHENSNARFIRPAGPYSRPRGYGYGGGYGLPLAGGLAGGMLLGGLLSGGMGGYGL